MTALAPQWGGHPAQVRLLCKRYAAKITPVPGDDSQVCEIDAVYPGGFRAGNQRDEAHQLLEVTPNPILDYARLQDALAGFGPAAQRQKILEAAKVERPLGPREAEALDMARDEDSGHLVVPIEQKIFAGAALAPTRFRAVEDPTTR